MLSTTGDTDRWEDKIDNIKEASKCLKKITNYNIESKEKLNMLFCVFSPTLPLTPPKNTEVVKKLLDKLHNLKYHDMQEIFAGNLFAF